jgi:trimeric autotransporter adhesin
VTSGAASAGNGTTTFTVAANTGAARLGTIVIAEHTFTIDQDPVPCAYSLSAPSASFAAAGGGGTVGVTANIQTCGWSAISNAGWITITGGAAGTGNGTVSYTVAVNSGAARTGTLTAAGKTFTVLQGAAGCTYSLYSWSSSWGAVGVVGGQTRVYTNQPSCTWNSISNVPWVTITSGQSGTGSEYVTFDVAVNPGLAREGTLTIAGRAYTVRQDGAPCSYSLSAAGADIGAAGGSGSLDVIASHPACPWTAVSSSPDWLAVTGGTAGTGNGTVSFTVLANAGDIRSATLTIAGHVFTVQQASPPCTYGIVPGSATWAALGGNGSIAVTTAFASCTWTAVSSVPWLTITSGAAGTGAGSVAYTVADNPGEPRAGTIAVAGYVFTVSQDKHGVPVRRGVPRR